MKKILFSTLFAIGVSTWAVSAQTAPCTGTAPADPGLRVNTTQSIANDVDSGNHGNWALDNYERHIQVWLDTDGVTYCAKVDYNGTFHAPAGVLSPQNGQVINQDVEGTMVGGYTNIIIGSLKPSPNIPSTLDYGGTLANISTWTQDMIPKAYNGGTSANWRDEVFAPGYTSEFTNGGNGWAWIYKTNGSTLLSSWLNAGTGGSGEISPVFDATSGNNYFSIQSAVDAAVAGDIIYIVAGTYNESVLINKPLTLVGVGTTKPVITGSADYAVKVDSASGVVLDNLEINGGLTNALNYGVLVTNSGTEGSPVEIKNSTIKNVNGGGASGLGVEASSYVLIHDNTISSFNKNGVRFIQSGGKFYGNSVIGESVDGTSRVQNLVNLRGGSNVEIYNNTLSNAITDPAVIPTWDSTGILVSAYIDGTNEANSTANIHDNDISFSDSGIVVTSDYASIDGSSATVVKNNFHNLTQAINFEKETGSVVVHNNKFETVTKPINAENGSGPLANPPVVDAEYNWWGTNDSMLISPLVVSSVDYSPWYTDATMTALRHKVITDAESTNTTTGGDDMTLSGTAGDVNVTAVVQAGTVITGSLDWDGAIAPPTATTTTITVSGFNTTVTSAIAIGSSLSDLTFDKAVKLTFAGQAGKHIGWTNLAGTFSEVTNVCTANDQATGDALPAGGNCKIDADGNLVVWTKHFTTFSTYTQTAVPVPSVSGGGYFVVSNTPASNVAVTATAATPNTNGQVLGEQISATASQNKKGKVLGATAYNFGRDLRLGSRGEDVAVLQQMLMDAGFMRVASSTTYFGSITKGAVVKWQKKMNLPATGYFGRLSRAAVAQ